MHKSLKTNEWKEKNGSKKGKVNGQKRARKSQNCTLRRGCFCFFFFFSVKFTVWNSVQQSRNGSFNAHAPMATFHTPSQDWPLWSEIPLKQQYVQWENQNKRGNRGSTGGPGCKVYRYKSSTVLWWKGFSSVLLLHGSPCALKSTTAKLRE